MFITWPCIVHDDANAFDQTQIHSLLQLTATPVSEMDFQKCFIVLYDKLYFPSYFSISRTTFFSNTCVNLNVFQYLVCLIIRVIVF